jgi:hypothetical protein
MRCVLLAAGVGLLWGAAVASAPAADATPLYIDLQAKANHKLADNFHSGAEGNNLASLPKGEQEFKGVKFKIEDGLIQLGSKLVEDQPDKVEGIKVDAKFTTLNLLHATGYGGGPNQEGNPGFVADDTVIGKYVVNYDDKTKEEIEIVYGKDVRDWWFITDEKGVSRGKVAWTGENEHSAKYEAKIRLYLGTWKNPHPDKKVTTIDYISTKETAAAPFCVAMTAETK